MILASHGIISSSGAGTPLLLDAYSGAAAAYSLRKLRIAYTGYSVRVRRSSDNTSQDIGFDANGNLDTTSLLSFVGAGNGFVSIWYDQSGNATDLSQPASANQPQIVSSGSLITRSGKPYFTCSTTQYFTLASMFSVTTTPYSMWMTYEKSATGNNSVIGSSTINYMWLDQGTTQTFSTISGSGITISSALSINTRFLINGLVNVTNTGANNLTSNMYTNNSLRGTKVSTVTFGGAYASTQAFPLSLSAYRVGTITTNEWIVYKSDQSSNRTGIDTNINTYYSIY